MPDLTSILLDAPGKSGKPIEIARLGTFDDPRYGSFSIEASDVEAWQNNLSLLPGGEVLVDRDHMSERSPRNSKALGWISNVRVSGDRVLADARWTPAGKKAIRNGSYRFASVAFGEMDTETGETIPNVLQSVALTNRPALRGLAAISLAQPERIEQAENALTLLDVSQADRDQAAKEGNALSDGSYPIRNASELHSAAVLAASHHGDFRAARKLIRKRASELGVTLSHLPGFASDGKGRKAKKQMMDAAATSARTLEQIAASGKVLLDAGELRELQQARVDLDTERFDAAFASALRSRRVTPGEREGLRRLYALDAVTTLESIGMRQPILPTEPTGEPSIQFDPADPDMLDPAEVERAGVDPRSIALDAQVRRRLTETNRPMASYAEALAEIAGNE